MQRDPSGKLQALHWTHMAWNTRKLVGRYNVCEQQRPNRVQEQWKYSALQTDIRIKTDNRTKPAFFLCKFNYFIALWTALWFLLFKEAVCYNHRLILEKIMKDFSLTGILKASIWAYIHLCNLLKKKKCHIQYYGSDKIKTNFITILQDLVNEIGHLTV